MMRIQWLCSQSGGNGRASRTLWLFLLGIAAVAPIPVAGQNGGQFDESGRRGRASANGGSRADDGSASFRPIRRLQGAEIRSHSGETLGTIDDIFFDHTGQVLFVVTEVDGDYLPIPFDAIVLEAGEDGEFALVDLDLELVLAAPRFGSLSRLRNPAHFKRVDTFFRDAARTQLRHGVGRRNDREYRRSTDRRDYDEERREFDRERFERDRRQSDHSKIGPS
jgi:hypothetical protein